MLKQFLPSLLILVSFQIFSQELVTKIVQDKNYEIKIPKDWEDMNISFGGASLTVLKPKSKKESNPVEAIVMKHVKTKKSSFQYAYQEYLGLLRGYYKQNFKIIKESSVTINERIYKKLIVKTISKINGKSKKNIMYYTYVNNESCMLTFMSTDKNFNKYQPLYDKIILTLNFF